MDAGGYIPDKDSLRLLREAGLAAGSAGYAGMDALRDDWADERWPLREEERAAEPDETAGMDVGG
ncbi:hypothetical protein PoMZ_12238 [Pyricularia oryzae]|uniref:Uncharacterized protein n=1 Tax=Pyricularia oryzae TaxID=318829 RepID=A0A4P7NML6_PYROR|nr:hypothetical protein PoMZ_12238 [Pyricularia oryzae]